MSSAFTLTQAHDALRSKKVSAVELTQSCFDQIERIDDKLHAVVHTESERALAQAKEIDQHGSFDHPLAGIPFLAKDIYCEVDGRTTACSNILQKKEYTPPFESTTTSRLKDQGAISLGKVNTDEFTMGVSTETSCYGVTRNPWDTNCVAGGSSGGSAASVAADECIFSVGTDTGGSIRQPAGFCGCTGLRTTYGRTSRYGAMSMASSCDTTGPLAKSVEDIAIILQAMAGKDVLDATTADREVPDYRSALTGDIKGMKLGLPQQYFIEGLDPEVESSVREAAKTLESLGAEIVDISLPNTEHAIATYYVIVPSEVSSNMARYDGIRYGHTVETPCYDVCTDEANTESDLVNYYHQVRSAGFGDEVKRRIMIGTYALSAGYYDAYYRKAQKVRSLIHTDFEEAYKQVDAIISPVSPTTAFKVGAHADDPLANYLEDVFVTPQVLAGIPALSVPCSFSSSGLPIGLQIMGPQWGEETILNIGHAYQQETDFHEKKPNFCI